MLGLRSPGPGRGPAVREGEICAIDLARPKKQGAKRVAFPQEFALRRLL